MYNTHIYIYILYLQHMYIYIYIHIIIGSSSKQLAAHIQTMLSEIRCCVTILSVARLCEKNVLAGRPSCQPPPQPTPCVPSIYIYIIFFIFIMYVVYIFHIKYSI